VWCTQSWGPLEVSPAATTLVLYTDATSVTYVTAYAVTYIVHFSLVGKIPTPQRKKPFDKVRAGFGWSTRTECN
jgi:hypothetical protein